VRRLCPGLNDVIRSIVRSLRLSYGVRTIYGFRFGYEGLVRRLGHEPLELSPEFVHRIHESGGSILGSSRGHQDAAEMVDYLEDMGVGILFAIGGDGTLRGAQKIGEEAARRGLDIGIIGVPQTRSSGARAWMQRPSANASVTSRYPTMVCALIPTCRATRSMVCSSCLEGTLYSSRRRALK
jgi:hypothetical protein